MCAHCHAAADAPTDCHPEADAPLPDHAESVPTATGVYERVRLATFEVNLFLPKQTPERRAEQVLALLDSIDLRRRIEETVLYYLRTRSFLKIVTAEVDE